MRRFQLFGGVAALCVSAGVIGAQAQPGRPVATVTPLAERSAIPPGRTARFALQVALPAGLHVQSNRPRDESLIPTVLSVDVPEGLTVAATVYPEATDLRQAGQTVPLAVYGDAFAVGVELAVDSKLPLGEISIPARLRYQACNDTTCFPPTTARFTWTVRVVPAADASPAAHRDVFESIAFARPRK